MSLIEQAADIVSLGHTLYSSNDEPCPRCKPEKGCWLHPAHPMNLIRARRMSRDTYRAYRHLLRERDYQAREQERDIENFRETHGYEMPYSIAYHKGYVE